MAERKYQFGSVNLLHSGDEYFAALEKIIRAANEVIYFQFYIFDLDETGSFILSALKEAAARGVQVYVMVDGFGSYHLGRDFYIEMRDAGIYFRHFSPLPFPGIKQAGRRLHVKVCVVDAKIAIVGGINISNRYRGTSDAKAWLDYALQAEGPIAEEVEVVCRQIWSRRFTRPARREQKVEHKGNYPIRIRVSLNDWFRSRSQISSGYKRMLRRARKEIIIIASYFLPGNKMLNALLYAVRHGKKVSVILSQQSDVPLVKDAIAYLYPKLLREGVTIYEYQTNILHAKACVIDEHWLSIGSHNLNNLSELMSVEMNFEVLNDKVAAAFADELKMLMQKECRLVTPEEFNQSFSLLKMFRCWLSYNVLSLIQRILYLFFVRETFPIKRSNS